MARGVKQPEREAGHEWSLAELAALRDALAVERPSAPGFWQRVADRVGRPVGQCRAQAFPGRHWSSVDEGCSEDIAQSAPLVQQRSCWDVAAEQLPQPPQLPVLPKSHGPRRAQLVHKFLAQHMLCSGHDFFDMGACGLDVPAIAPLPATDVLPRHPQEDLLVELASVGRVPLSSIALYARRRHLREELEERVDSDVDLRPCDHTFAPRGIEGFICRLQSPCSSKRKAISVLDEDAPTPWKTKRVRRKEMVRAEALFRKIDYQAGMGDLEVTWEEEDDDAPVACIPSF